MVGATLVGSGDGPASAVQYNSVTFDGPFDGVGMFGGSSHSTVRLITNNAVNGNGFHGLSVNRAAGIRIFLQADRTLVQGNVADGNAGAGLGVDSPSNRLLRNTAGGNGVIDRRDSNPGRDATSGTATPASSSTPPAPDALDAGGPRYPAIAADRPLGRANGVGPEGRARLRVADRRGPLG
ncbi:MAG: right-handed parallel beta-helix repeat-containing protein [Acidimicrobiales bacterium]